jgi:hypothetical protein
VLRHIRKEDTNNSQTPVAPSVPEPAPVVSSSTASSTTILQHKPANSVSNRLSMFEKQANPQPARPKKPTTCQAVDSTSSSESSKSTENLDDVIQEYPIAGKTKPLPPVPPVKPPRPVLPNKQTSQAEDQPTVPTFPVKLRPVQTNINNGNATTNHNGNDKLNNELKSNIIFNTNHNNLNGINNHNNLNSLSVHNNSSLRTNRDLISNESNDENGGGVNNKTIGIQRLQDPDKRTSVRELAQMMFEESKVGIDF